MSFLEWLTLSLGIIGTSTGVSALVWNIRKDRINFKVEEEYVIGTDEVDPIVRTG